MSFIVIKGVFWLIFGVLVALLEIEIEGKYGWAQKAPTWCRTSGRAVKILNFYLQGKPLTGYHSALNVLFIMVFHVQFVMGLPWSAAAELETAAIYFAWLTVWDFFWFILNPYYGVKKFRKENVWWFQYGTWYWGRIPDAYVSSTAASLILAGAGSLVAKSWRLLIQDVAIMAIFALGLITCAALAPAYGRWYYRMRERNDWPLVNVYHKD